MSQSVAEAKGQANVTVSHDEKFKTGQKFSTPAPGNGKFFECVWGVVMVYCCYFTDFCVV